MTHKTNVSIIALGFVVTLLGYQNCGKSTPAEHATQMENAGAQGEEKLIVDLGLRPERNPFIHQASNNNLIWSANPNRPLFYAVFYSNLEETSDTRVPTNNLWITLPASLRVGAYRATLYSCYIPNPPNIPRDCLFNSYTRFDVVNSQGGGTPTPNPSPTSSSTPGGGGNSNFTFNFNVGFTTVQGTNRTRMATENSPHIEISYNTSAPISFKTETTGHGNNTVCIFRDPNTSNGGCLPNKTYLFPAGHFTGPWYFEVTVRSGAVSKTRRITFTPY